MNVFTYGSLMYAEVWERVVRGRHRSLPARLRGFRRRAVVGAAYPGAVPQAGAEIRGRVYLDVDSTDVARLDAFEASEYRRDEVLVLPEAPQAGATPLQAQVYVYLDADRLAAHDWDPRRFEREQLAGFADRHGAAGR